MPEEDQERFSVDTHLFRELGELLVGRDSTALVELVKNSYDADATNLSLFATGLDDPTRGYIQLADNGVGMTREQFRRGFLRIASRTKQEGQRRSKIYDRQFTGAKGIGRLAAHKLARSLYVNTVSNRSGAKEFLSAHLDWDVIESYETLDEVSEGISLSTHDVAESMGPGTDIQLHNLRRGWTSNELGQLIRQVRGFSPPDIFASPLPRSLVGGRVLFDRPTVRDNAGEDPGFQIQLEGDLDAGEEYWAQAVAGAAWIIEVNAQPGSALISMAPTRATREENPEVESVTFETDYKLESGPFFNARIVVRPGKGGKRGENSSWYVENSGIRVYLEGFRVLPYGELRDDWLGIDFDYSRRVEVEGIDPTTRVKIGDPEVLEARRRRNLVGLSNRGYFGAVFLTEQRAPTLRALVNREGFVPDESFDELVRILRLAINLNIRVRSRYTASIREERSTARAASSGNQYRDGSSLGNSGIETPPAHTGSTHEPSMDSSQVPRASGTASRLSYALSDMDALIGDLRSQARISGSDEHLGQLAGHLEAAREAALRVADDIAELRVLATVGTQLASFVHEVQNLLSQISTAEANAAEISSPGIVPLRNILANIRRGLERQAAYLLDVVTPDARRRRSRQLLRDRVDAAFALLSSTTERRGVRLLNAVDIEIRTPPMFPAEILSILINLLTNAIKAAGTDGRVEVRSAVAQDALRLVVLNTGAAIDVEDSERWFEPYESTTVEVDPILGQGMGLGLPITRALVAEYRGLIRFTAPADGYATSVEVTIPY